jgi:propionyl-CoA carboxylase alpha chain
VIRSILVANRGEIARRVLRTARDLGIGTVAVYSDADTDAPHVREAEAAVHLPGNSPTETYLRAELLVNAALRAGADAIHPGYGFLSENAAFARAVQAAGLIWVGPSPASIDSMGSKIEAKRLMAAAGVATLTELDPKSVTQADLPVLIKASAGGGGRGMRIVRALADLPAEIEAARSEAASAFGDPTVFCEPYLATGRHIEVQVLADQHGTVWAVGERECSIQRRHQKVIEEAPSPLVERRPTMRAELFEAARKAAAAVGYVGAGTVEFIADDDGRFFFLEMNTRLQVEHPVTEATTGLDLVRWQLRIADGAALPAEPPAPTGHSIEARLYAEDPAAGWQPQSGTVHRFQVPGVVAEFSNPAGYGLRLDSGIADGSVVGVHYDPMLAKVISYAPTRDEAASGLAGALAAMTLHGLRTNRDLLVRVLRHPAFLAGETDTAFFDRHGLDALAAPLADKTAVELSALAAALGDAAHNRAKAKVLGRLPSGWRNLVSQPQQKRYRYGEDELSVNYRFERGQLIAEDHPEVTLLTSSPDQVVLAVAGVRRAFAVARYPGLRSSATVEVDSPLGAVSLEVVDRFPDPSAQLAPGSLIAPMPGTVVRVAVAAGDPVTAGQPLLWLEAMKMEHQISAPSDGVVHELNVVGGQQVDVGEVLVVVADMAVVADAGNPIASSTTNTEE